MELQRGLQELTVATQLDAQQRYGEAVQAYRSGIALLYLACVDATESFRQMLVGKIGEYQRRADQLALLLAGGGPAPSHQHQQPSQRPTQPAAPSVVQSRAGPAPAPSGPSQASHAGLDIPKHALVAFSQSGASAPGSGAAQGPSHRFADDEDRALMERVMQLRMDAASAGGGAGGDSGGGGTVARSTEDVDREYRERVNRLAGREVIADPSAPRPSVIDVEELTEEEQIERIMNAIHDDVRLEILGGPVAASSASASSDRERARPRRGERSRRRRRRHANDSSDDSSSTDGSDDSDSNTASSDSDDEEEAERRRRRRARMERERDLTFGQKWALRKKEREDQKKGRDGGGGSAGVPSTDPLREREKAFMARKEKEEQDKERKYRAEFIRKYGNI